MIREELIEDFEANPPTIQEIDDFLNDAETVILMHREAIAILLSRLPHDLHDRVTKQIETMLSLDNVQDLADFARSVSPTQRSVSE